METRAEIAIELLAFKAEKALIKGTDIPLEEINEVLKIAGAAVVVPVKKKEIEVIL